ncbi:uncharacterized protein LOC129592239 [Paramacrobiotus metropolitanus]|uniref:uncharacterized protein LOC129592239 n=1 Tax=Paramacrobiotus metropolitanus TaxID=2943436 RepID=UPI002445DFFF|nr:uncharacterized protein LOC129592239 [Paramacrobiotus metropolitanus]XP_055344194.1 uncharacterized protein LOC129592239 [Paramacrobiotus metropolitanus]
MPPVLDTIPKKAEPERDDQLNADSRSAAVQRPSGKAHSSAGHKRYESVSAKKTVGPQPPHAWNMYNLTPAERQEILDLYDNGHTCSHILRRTNLSIYHVKQLLCAAGRTASFRNRDQKRVENTIQEVSLTSKTRPAILDAGLPSKTPPVRICLSHCAIQNKYNEKQKTAAKRSRRKGRDPWIGRQPAQAAEGVRRSDSGDELPDAGVGISILSDDEQCEFTTEDMERFAEKTGAAKHRSGPENITKTDILEVDIEKDTAFRTSSVRRKIKEEIIEYSSTGCISPDKSVETASEIFGRPSEILSRSGRSARYHCQICRLSWDKEEAFLLHFTQKEHEQLFASGVFLYCTGCKFKTRKPVKMGRHIIDYQSQWELRDGSMHSVKITH